MCKKVKFFYKNKGPAAFKGAKCAEEHISGQEAEFCKKHIREFQRIHKFLIYFRPGIFIFTLLVLYFLFRGVGMQSVGIFLVILLFIKEVGQFVFLWRLEKRILNPIGALKDGVDEVAKGNYSVHIECSVENEIGLLVKSFNDMVKKLLEAENLKNEYEENRKTLIANISHDLKTPITSIQGYIEALQEPVSVPQENVQKYLQIIYRNTTYMNKLIDDLFLFSKLDLNKLEFDFQSVHIKGFMADLMQEFQFDLEEKQVRFSYIDKVKEDIELVIDSKRLYQAIGNIIGNAVKYGNGEGLFIQVQMEQNDDGLLISIADNGPGISEDKLPYIFNRFYRIDNERTKDLISTGLGLAIAKELVEAHGGKIEVTSSLGIGTTFVIFLPVRSK